MLWNRRRLYSSINERLFDLLLKIPFGLLGKFRLLTEAIIAGLLMCRHLEVVGACSRKFVQKIT